MGKKTAILTVHKGINIGSYLQAYALKTQLEKQGNSVKFIDNKSRQPKRMMLSSIKNNVLHGNIKNALFSYKLFSAFIKADRYFDEKPLSSADDFDCVILGSDEIWNVKRPVIGEYHSFFGEGINTKKISYAPSINNAEAKDLNKKYIIDCLKTIDKISVRDNHSKEVIEQLTGKSAQLVCDPTWLLTPDEYPNVKSKQDFGKYILVYMYNSEIEENEIKAMQKIAKDNDCRLISVNNKNDWCDRVAIAPPFEYLDILKNASFVFTNTFHGTILSVLYNIPFASFEKNNMKIGQILEYVGLTDRKVSENNPLEKVFENSIDWETVNTKIMAFRESSRKFLKSSV